MYVCVSTPPDESVCLVNAGGGGYITLTCIFNMPYQWGYLRQLLRDLLVL